jgi:hypothetical protein
MLAGHTVMVSDFAQIKNVDPFVEAKLFPYGLLPIY